MITDAAANPEIVAELAAAGPEVVIATSQRLVRHEPTCLSRSNSWSA